MRIHVRLENEEGVSLREMRAMGVGKGICTEVKRASVKGIRRECSRKEGI